MDDLVPYLMDGRPITDTISAQDRLSLQYLAKRNCPWAATYVFEGGLVDHAEVGTAEYHAQVRDACRACCPKLSEGEACEEAGDTLLRCARAGEQARRLHYCAGDVQQDGWQIRNLSSDREYPRLLQWVKAELSSLPFFADSPSRGLDGFVQSLRPAVQRSSLASRVLSEDGGPPSGHGSVQSAALLESQSLVRSEARVQEEARASASGEWDWDTYRSARRVG